MNILKRIKNFFSFGMLDEIDLTLEDRIETFSNTVTENVKYNSKMTREEILAEANKYVEELRKKKNGKTDRADEGGSSH
jgi:isopropylmalate/homocitrate/citramalate synthase